MGHSLRNFLSCFSLYFCCPDDRELSNGPLSSTYFPFQFFFLTLEVLFQWHSANMLIKFFHLTQTTSQLSSIFCNGNEEKEMKSVARLFVFLNLSIKTSNWSNKGTSLRGHSKRISSRIHKEEILLSLEAFPQGRNFV